METTGNRIHQHNTTDEATSAQERFVDPNASVGSYGNSCTRASTTDTIVSGFSCWIIRLQGRLGGSGVHLE